MKKYVCTVCGYVYDEAKGIPEAGIAPGTKWEALAQNWVCPLCGAAKIEFREQGETPAAAKRPLPVTENPADIKEMSALEVSAVCSNLARGCEKQYKNEDAALFKELADYYKSIAAPEKESGFGNLLSLIESDLETGFPKATAISKDDHDRGALRALTWSEKVTRIQKTLLARYQKEGDTWLDGTGLYVCTVCGFIFAGDAPPELCPVCKVPSWKFEKVEGR